MAKEAIKKEVVVKEVETLKFVITFPDGTVSEGTTTLRQFAPNMGKGFQNSGFQVKVASGNYSGSIMIIDYLKQTKI
jgi:hypothetical protein